MPEAAGPFHLIKKLKRPARIKPPLDSNSAGALWVPKIRFEVDASTERGKLVT